MANKPKRSAGRPRELADAEKRERLLAHLRQGCSRADASRMIGITHRTLNAEAQRDAAFAKELEAAEAQGKINLYMIVRKGAKDDPKWAAWILERKWYKEWAKRNPDNVTPEQMAAAVARIIAYITTVVPKKYHKKVHEKVEEIMTVMGGMQK